MRGKGFSVRAHSVGEGHVAEARSRRPVRGARDVRRGPRARAGRPADPRAGPLPRCGAAGLSPGRARRRLPAATSCGACGTCGTCGGASLAGRTKGPRRLLGPPGGRIGDRGGDGAARLVAPAGGGRARGRGVPGAAHPAAGLRRHRGRRSGAHPAAEERLGALGGRRGAARCGAAAVLLDNNCVVVGLRPCARCRSRFRTLLLTRGASGASNASGAGGERHACGPSHRPALRGTACAAVGATGVCAAVRIVRWVGELVELVTVGFGLGGLGALGLAVAPDSAAGEEEEEQEEAAEEEASAGCIDARAGRGEVMKARQ